MSVTTASAAGPLASSTRIRMPGPFCPKAIAEAKNKSANNKESFIGFLFCPHAEWFRSPTFEQSSRLRHIALRLRGQRWICTNFLCFEHQLKHRRHPHLAARRIAVEQDIDAENLANI